MNFCLAIVDKGEKRRLTERKSGLKSGQASSADNSLQAAVASFLVRQILKATKQLYISPPPSCLATAMYSRALPHSKRITHCASAQKCPHHHLWRSTGQKKMTW